jgi:hypothetical protein
VVGEGKKGCPKKETKMFLMRLKFRDLCKTFLLKPTLNIISN